MGTKSSFSSLERRERISRMIDERKRVTVNEISELFSVSRVCARQDLNALADQGKVLRVRGGAVAINRAPPEPPVLQRAQEQSEEKQRIGQAAARLIEDGETVFMGSGTTVLEVARHLSERRNLTVITNSLLVANALAESADVTVIMLGGILRKNELSFTGYITENNLNDLQVNKVILGMRAVDVKRGFTNDFLGEMTTDRAIIKCGSEVIVVADQTKCGRVATAFFAPITAMHTLVTNEGISQEFAQAIKNLGIRLVVV